MFAARMNGPTGGKRVPTALTIRARPFWDERGFLSKFLNFRPAIWPTGTDERGVKTGRSESAIGLSSFIERS